MLEPLAEKSFSKEVYDRNGSLLRLTLSDDQQYRIFRKLEKIDSQLQEAVLLSEDRYFYYHWGVNPFSMVRAFLSLHQDRPYGASTITMQMVRLRDKIYTKSVSGKFIQIVKAFQAEFLYSKKQILEAYLNLTPYGANIEGVGAASLIYFNKQTDKLSLSESLLLAIIPQNPVKRNLQAEDQRKAFEARDRLYSEWKLKQNSKESLNFDLKLPLLSQKISELPFKAPHFVNFVIKHPQENLENTFKTTLDLRIQQLIEVRLKHYLDSKKNYGIKNGAVLLVHTGKKEIRSWVGSNDFFDAEIQGQIDAITTPRSPGSALKPFLYALALDEGLIHPQTLLFDTPSSFGIYDPENFDRSYKGPLSAEEALIQSRNVPAIYLASRLKKKSLYHLLQETNADLPQNESYYGLAIALGAAEITPLNLANLYTSFANLGKWSSLQWELNPIKIDKPKNIFSAEASYMILDMLKKNIHSESALIDEVSKEKMSIAWKTGTSYGYRDAWVAGVFADHVLVVWLGNFDNSSNPALVGREITAPLFFEIAALLKNHGFLKDGNWELPLGLKIKSVDVCSVTGAMTNGACPHTKKAWFNPGVSPIDECNVHREYLVSKSNGQRVCDIQQFPQAQKEVFEFWPSDIVQFFVKYGLPFKKAPPFDESCEQKSFGQYNAPEIVSPKADLTYSVRFNSKDGYDKIPLKAKVDQEIKKVFWFANQKPISESLSDDTLMVELNPGLYEISVVDDHGQMTSRSVQVKLIQ